MAPCGSCQCISLACLCPYQYPSSPGLLCCFARCFGCVALLSLWLRAHLQLGRGFLMLPACPSPSLGLLVDWFCGFSSPLGFPTFAMGSPLRGRGLFVLDRTEGLVSPFGSGTLVSSWLDLPPLSADICVPCHSGCVARWSSLCPYPSVHLSSLQGSSLSLVRVQCCLPVPC